MEVTGSTAIPFAAGVIGEPGDGESGKLTLYVCKVAGLNPNLDGVTPADVRRVTYWMTDKGLARQEVPWVTSERLQVSTDLYLEDGREPDSFVIAEEVTKVQFAYWDGSTWADTWDGRRDRRGGLKGPPMAIRVSLLDEGARAGRAEGVPAHDLAAGRPRAGGAGVKADTRRRQRATGRRDGGGG